MLKLIGSFLGRAHPCIEGQASVGPARSHIRATWFGDAVQKQPVRCRLLKVGIWTYQRAMVTIRESRQYLDYLIFAVGQGLPLTPSWCVDFSRKRKLEHMDNWEIQRRYGMTGLGVATGRGTSQLKHDTDQDTIMLRGTSVDTITSMQTLTINTNTQSDGTDYVQILLSQVRLLKTFRARRLAVCLGHPTASSKIEAGDIWRLAANSQLIEELLGVCPGTAGSYAIVARHGELDVHDFFRKDFIRPERDFIVAWDAYSKLVELTAGLRVFATDTGYVGSSYGQDREGDIVATAFGCQLALLLRPIDCEIYTLFDAVYVDMIMRGDFRAGKAGYTETEYVQR